MARRGFRAIAPALPVAGLFAMLLVAGWAAAGPASTSGPESVVQTTPPTTSGSTGGSVGWTGASAGLDAQTLTVGSPRWTAAPPQAAVPSAPFSSMAYDSSDREFVAFGGEPTPGSLPIAFTNATWLYRTGGWTSLCPQSDVPSDCGTVPAARAGALLAYDPDDRDVVMTGGVGAVQNASGWHTVNESDVWTFAGSGWTEVNQSAPEGLWDGEMTYDVHDGFLLALTDAGVTWNFSNGSWSKVDPFDGVHPTARAHAALYYDPVREAVILYGGVSGSGKVLNDTWEFQGGSWTKLSFPIVPNDRRSATLTLPEGIPAGFDANLGVGVVVDPAGDGGNATWILGSTGWVNVSADLGRSLPLSSGGTLAFDPTDGFGLLLDFPDGLMTSSSYLFSDPLRISPGVVDPVIDANETAVVSPSLTGGLVPYTTATVGAPGNCQLAAADSASPTVTCPETDAGTYNLTLGYTDAAGRSANVSYRLVVHADPDIAISTITPDPTSAGIPVHFGAAESLGTPPYTTPNWTFSSASSVTSSGPSHTYDVPGNYTVVVLSKDSTGRTFTTRAVVVVNAGPAADLGSSRSATDPGFPIAFSAAVFGGTGAKSCAWNFGDGATASTCNVTYSYASHGNFDAAFWVNDSVGATDRGTVPVFVAAPLDASWAGATTGVAGESLGLDVAESGGIAPFNVSWNFGDGGTATGDSVDHDYGIAGTYAATAVVTDAVGARSVVEEKIVVAVDAGSVGGTPGQTVVAPSPGGSLLAPDPIRASAAPTPLPWGLFELVAALGAAAAISARTERTLRRVGRPRRGWLSRQAVRIVAGLTAPDEPEA